MSGQDGGGTSHAGGNSSAANNGNSSNGASGKPNRINIQHLDPKDFLPPRARSSLAMDENNMFSFFTNVWRFTGTVIPHILPQVHLLVHSD
jgi:hypothetical protein